jgi:hypothetical protein
MTQEEKRLQEAINHQAHWRKWGCYLSDRAWGTVREDYSENGTAWDYFNHDQARSRAYRWGEDGLLGICDHHQRLCLAIALWNSQDPILKEILFGLSENEGNHGEDVKEYYFYLDNTPTHSYMKALYKYPQAAFPYKELVAENRRRDRLEPEFELLDTGIFNQNRYFNVFVEYAKHTTEDILVRIEVINRSTESKLLHLLPTLWFRNTWTWNGNTEKPILQAGVREEKFSSIEAFHPTLGKRWLYCQNLAADRPTSLLFTENETNNERLFGSSNTSAYVKDGINDYIVEGRQEAINPQQTGTKAAAHYVLEIAPGESQTIQLRLSDVPLAEPFNSEFDHTITLRKQEADEFYQRVTPVEIDADMRNVERQAFAGMLWSKNK